MMTCQIQIWASRVIARQIRRIHIWFEAHEIVGGRMDLFLNVRSSDVDAFK